MTTDRDTEWIEKQIAAGILGAESRGECANQAAHEYNVANDIPIESAEHLFSPGQAQATAREVLRTLIGDLPETLEIVLSDVDDAPNRQFRVSPSRLEAAVDQFRQLTGDVYSTEGIMRGLSWEE